MSTTQTPSIPPVASSQERPLRVIVLCLDALIVAASMICAWALQNWLRDIAPLQALLGLRASPAFEHYALLLYLTLPMELALVAWFELHRWFERALTRTQLMVGLLKVHLTSLLGLTLVLFLTQTVINRSILALFLLCTFVLQLAARELLGRWQRFRHQHGHNRARVLLVGDSGPGMDSWVERSQRAPFPPEIVGWLQPAPNSGRFVSSRGAALAPQRGQLLDLDRVLHQEPIDRVLFFPPLNDAAQINEALRACETLGVPAALMVDMTPQSLARPRIEFHFGQPFVEFELAPRAPGALLLKHGFDVVLASLGLVMVAPLLLLIACAIVLTMGRPVLFVQERAGMRGRRFRMIKFRTMVSNAEASQASLRRGNIAGGPVFKLRDDPRVTRLGKLLRTTSLDELPQLLNVVTGQMSLVGPRPLPSGEQEQIVGWHRRRLSMKPGITGLWQVSGRSSIAFERWMELDLEYVDHWSLGEDVRILLKTVPALWTRRGAH